MLSPSTPPPLSHKLDSKMLGKLLSTQPPTIKLIKSFMIEIK